MPLRSQLIAALLTAVLATPGCLAPAAPASWTSPEAVVLDLPLVRQDELHECGLAAVTALVRYWGAELDPSERARLATLAEQREGLSGAELRESLERSGWEVWIFAGELDRSPVGLRHHVDAGRPPIVMISPSGETHHYCLVLGYDPPARSILLLDPRRGRLAVDEGRFLQAWEASRRFTLLALPPAAADAAQEQARTGTLETTR
jgi:ABC-type bacteriocin/lantibiotic exporter with double-glycine peptidase domain